MRKATSLLEFRSAQASASAGATARTAPSGETDKDVLFRILDIDGDGRVSKAEAAGNAYVTLGFDRADRNKDGRLSRAEYDSIGKAAEKKAQKQVAQKQAAQKQARAKDSASAGGTATSKSRKAGKSGSDPD